MSISNLCDNWSKIFNIVIKTSKIFKNCRLSSGIKLFFTHSGYSKKINENKLNNS